VNGALSLELGNHKWQRQRGLPEPPTAAFYRTNLTLIIERLLRDVPGAQIGICSIPPIGEQMDVECQRRVVTYNTMVHDHITALQAKGETRVSYIPVYESLAAILQQSKHRSTRVYDPRTIFKLLVQVCQSLHVLPTFLH
jgi:hypothetical protein